MQDTPVGSDDPNAASWPPVRTEDGSWTLSHPGHGQACHSRSGAWLESLERYAIPCRLRALAEERGTSAPVRLLDIGLGIGWNLAAALSEVRAGGGQLEVLGLESCAGLPARATELAERSGVGAWSPHYEAVAALLRGQPAPSGLRLELRLGDATQTLGAEPGFDAIFLDAFSPGVETSLWAWPFLRRLAGVLKPNGILSTYTVSTEVRAGLLAAGLRLGAGPQVGAKRCGTLASPRAGLPPIDPRAARRAQRRADCGPAQDV
ncbi:MAG: hypothetical protein H8D72_01235 [Planctomycetes bacterium]|nr:hypothetical protein [Planctomycetota bacterium]